MTDYESCVGVPNILPLKCQTSRVWHMFIREFGFTHYTKNIQIKSHAKIIEIDVNRNFVTLALVLQDLSERRQVHLT